MTTIPGRPGVEEASQRAGEPSQPAMSRPLRVLLCTAHPRDLTLGSPKYVYRLGQGLAHLGHEVEYLFADDVPQFLRDRRLLYASFPALVASRALRGGHDVVHVASGDAVLLAAVGWAVRRRPWALVNLVLGMEHTDAQELKRATPNSAARLNLRHRVLYEGVRLRQVEASIRASDAVMCLCDQDRRFVIEHGWQPGEAVKVIRPGVDPAFVREGRLGDPEPIVFFLGTWTSRKGVAELVAAMVRVRERIPAARLVVAGAHRDSADVLADFPERVRSAVTVVPTISDPPDRLVELMENSAVGAMPSHYEGFGMAFLEMMSVGLPVVGTATGGMADLIEHGRNGLLVPSRDDETLSEALLELLSDPHRRRRMAGEALHTARGLTWQRAAEGANDLYQSALRARLR